MGNYDELLKIVESIKNQDNVKVTIPSFFDVKGKAIVDQNHNVFVKTDEVYSFRYNSGYDGQSHELHANNISVTLVKDESKKNISATVSFSVLDNNVDVVNESKPERDYLDFIKTLNMVAKENKDNGFQLFLDKDALEFSKFDFISQYAVKDDLSVADLIESVNSYSSSGQINFKPHKYLDYWSNKFQKMLDMLSNCIPSEKLKKDINDLVKKVNDLKTQLLAWLVNASDTEKATINSLINEIDFMIEKIKYSSAPAISRADQLKENLNSLKSSKEKLCGEVGYGGFIKEIEDLSKEIIEKQKAYEEFFYNEPRYDEFDVVTKEDGSFIKKSKGTETKAHAAWRINKHKAEDAREGAKYGKESKENEMKAFVPEVDRLLEEVLKSYFLVLNLEKIENLFNKFFTKGSSESTWISSKDSIVEHSKEIMKEFEDMKIIPISSSLSGYYDEVGDYHNYEVGNILKCNDLIKGSYKVTQGYDPKNGILKIVPVTSNGVATGDEIVIRNLKDLEKL